MSPFAIETTNLTKTYATPRGKLTAVRDVNLTLPRGELFGLFGANGAGKSTLIRMLATLLDPSAGEARINGFDTVRQADAVRASVGLVFSNEHSFYGRLSGRQNLNFFAALQNLGRREAARRIDELLDMFDLRAAANAMFQTYSTGMRQKLNVARALLHNPPILFLDEPTKGMDVPTADAVRTLLKEEIVIRQGKTVFLTTHDLYEMEHLCDRIGVIARGAIQALGSPRELLHQQGEEKIYFIELVAPVAGLSARLNALDNIRVVSEQDGRLEIACMNVPGQEVWDAVYAAGGQVRRFAPQEEGLRALLRRAAQDEYADED